MLIDRRGRVEKVLLGDSSGLTMPDLPKARTTGHLRGLRLLHTHLNRALLNDEDCLDLVFLRLDNIAVISVDEWGEPAEFQYAHLLPFNEEGKAYEIYPALRWDQVDMDFLSEIEAIEDELVRTMGEGKINEGVLDTGLDLKGNIIPDTGAGSTPETRAILVSVSTAPRVVQESELQELSELAATAGVLTVGTLTQRLRRINPRYIMGKGKLAELETLSLQTNAGIIIFDGELSPAQLRNLVEVTERRVVDRTQLILDIFAQRASTKAGQYQVELAQLQYTLPRLAGKSGIALDKLEGGIGGRGPGETKLETDRRRIRSRITRIKEDLKKLRRQRSYARDRRQKSNISIASLVGYTNAGKSTLLNILTDSKVFAENKLFATLDPTTRRLRFPEERDMIITDTVGFIRSLPQELMEAFQATLEELEQADLLLHVADVSHFELDLQIKAVNKILKDLEFEDKALLLILNKVDLISDEDRRALETLYPDAIFISALGRENLNELTDAIIRRIDWDSRERYYQGHDYVESLSP